MIRKQAVRYGMIALGSILYAVGTVFFIFPHALLLGGTSGISVILNRYVPFSPGVILAAINVLLMILAFVLLGRGVAIATFVGSMLTTFGITLLERLEPSSPLIPNIYVSAAVGSAIIALASGVMFYVDSSSGGTDIVALIVRKYSRMNIGRALFVSDVLIVLAGGLILGPALLFPSFLGFLIKVLGIDLVIALIRKFTKKGWR